MYSIFQCSVTKRTLFVFQNLFLNEISDEKKDKKISFLSKEKAVFYALGKRKNPFQNFSQNQKFF